MKKKIIKEVAVSTDLLHAFQFNLEVYKSVLKDAKKQRRTKDEWITYGRIKGLELAILLLMGE